MNPLDRPASYSHQEESARQDAALVARMARGDERALGQLFDRWDVRVRAVATGIVGDPMDAEEVVEDTFWQAWRQADRFDAGRGAVGPWLLTVARSRALDRVRSLRRSREDGLDDAADHADDRAVDALLAVADRETGERVRAEIDRLPEKQRKVVDLAYFEGLSQSEIAAREGEPLGTVKTRLRLALARLRERFGPASGGRP